MRIDYKRQKARKYKINIVVTSYRNRDKARYASGTETKPDTQRNTDKADTPKAQNEGNRLLAFDWNFLGLLPCSTNLI